MKCKRCNEELKGNNYYTYYTKVGTLCKSCLVEEYMAELSVTKGNVERAIHTICDRYNLVFKRELLKNRRNEGLSLTAIFKNYMRDITTLPQYSRLDSKDSDLWNAESSQFKKICDKEESRTVVEFLENERLQLQSKLDKALNNDDASLYSKYIQAYERTLLLLQKESWQEKFSHYHSDGKELISTWEQKGEDIRNKKVYEVKEIKEVTKDNKILTKQYGETTEMINKTTPMIVYYEKDKDLDVKKFLLNIKAIDYTHYHEFECLYNNTLPNGYSTTDEQSKELLLQINDSQFKVIGGELKDFDVSEYINEGVNTINIFSYTQYRVTASYTCEGYMNI